MCVYSSAFIRKYLPPERKSTVTLTQYVSTIFCIVQEAWMIQCSLSSLEIPWFIYSL